MYVFAFKVFLPVYIYVFFLNFVAGNGLKMWF